MKNDTKLLEQYEFLESLSDYTYSRYLIPFKIHTFKFHTSSLLELEWIVFSPYKCVKVKRAQNERLWQLGGANFHGTKVKFFMSKLV